MLTLTLFKFAKRQNSTAAPASGTGVDVSIVLKDQTQILTPTFILEWATYPDYNYAQFMGRYYWISTIESIRDGIWSLSARVDLLATYKANILNTSAFVAYDTTANTEITDRRLSTKTTTVRAEAAGNAFDFIGSGQCVVINVVGEETCASYALDVSDAAKLLDTISTWKPVPDTNVDPDPGPPADEVEGFEYLVSMLRSIGENIADALTIGFRQIIASGNAASCIRSAFVLPMSVASLPGTPNQQIKLGLFTSTITGKLITNRAKQDASYVTIPWQASDWRRNAPYHEVYLYIPFVGVISYPASALIGASGLYVDVAMDVTAGDCLVTVTTDAIAGGAANHVLGMYAANIAGNFAIGSSNVSPRQVATAVGAGAGVAAASVFTGGAALLAAGAAGISGEFNAMRPTPSSVGGAGGGAILAQFGYSPRCMVIFHDTTVAPDSVSAVIGTPANAVKSLSGLTGYVETRSASVSGDMLESERSQLNQLLDGGIYIE